MDELKPCPFCGALPTFPDANDVYGTCYDAGCDECGIATISLQIIDCFDHPRNYVHDSWNNETFQYGIEFIEVARQQAVKTWNTRASDWNHMEAAPRDGREIILKVKYRAGIPGKCLVGHYMGGGHCIEDHPPISAGWYFWNGCMFDKAAEPIGWMPLPPTGDE